MKQIFFHKTKGPIIDEVPAPTCQDYGVLVQVYYSLISSGTETRVVGMVETNEKATDKIVKNVGLAKKVASKVMRDGVKKTIDLVNMVRNRIEPMGYSAAGKVIEVGKHVRDINVGDRVVCGGTGFANHAEIIYAPRNLVSQLPDNLTFKEACFTTVGSVALQGVRQAKPVFGESVAVIGLGLIGLIAMQIFKVAGVRVVGFDINQARVDQAKKLGADQAYNLNDVDPVVITQEFTNNVGMDSVLLAAQTPSNEPLNLALQMLRVRGRLSAVGATGLNIEKVEDFIGKEIVFRGSHAYGPGRYDFEYEERGVDYPVGYVRWTSNRNMGEFVRLISEKKINVLELIDLEYPVEKAAEAYDNFASAGKRPIGIVLKYNEELGNKLKRKFVTENKTIKKGRLNGAIIGCGQWSELHHVPNILAMDDVNLKAVMGVTGSKIKRMAEKYKVDYYTTDYKDILKDPEIDFVIVATRNRSHYSIAKEAIEAGKPVLLEKPMTMTRDEMVDLAEVVEKSGIPFGVGFNRRYSPFARKVKTLISDNNRPVMIMYRVSGGPHGKYWGLDPVEGGGLIIGEACHYFDFFNYMIGKEITDYKVSSIPINGNTVLSNHDNIVVTIKYSDNSLASLLYSSLGTEAIGKEYIEIHSNHNIAVIDDYKKLRFYGNDNKDIDIKQDKGMKAEVEEFVKLLKGEKSEFISLQDSVKATELCFDVIDQIRNELQS